MENLQMKTFSTKAILAAAAVAATLLPAGIQAQTQPLFVIAGSSALFNTFGYANFQGAGALTGPFSWTYKSGTAVAANNGNTAPCTADTNVASVVINDSTRNINIANEPGTVWVAWNAAETTSPRGAGAQLSAYINVDSAVGVRAALAVPEAVLQITNIPAGTCGQNKVPNQQDTPLPATVLADLSQALGAPYSINGAIINLAAADIRVEDAKFATDRALAALGAHGFGNSTRQNAAGLGYGGEFGPNIGWPIQGAAIAGGGIANPVNFAIFGSDPISGQPAFGNLAELNVGAGPVLVFVNTSQVGAGHFGDPNLTNITEWQLSGFLDGSLSRTRDAQALQGLGAFGSRTFIREPLSGTYNTMEYNIPNTARELSSQELGVNVVAGLGVAQNPLNDTYASGGGRSRTIGTGNMVTAVKATADSLGYAFWSYGNFTGVLPAQAKYLTVNGVDPLYANYSTTNGAFPQPVGSPATFPAIPFPNVLNGSYPIWTIFRVVVPNPAANGAIANALVAAVQPLADGISDFVAINKVNVFRSHYFQESVGADNGHRPGLPLERGGDVGGAPFNIQSDIDYFTDTNNVLIQHLQ
jgi:hypothetical protein